MNVPGKRRSLIVCAHLVSLVCGLAGFAAPVAAHNPASAPASQPDTVAISALSDAGVLADEELKERVKVALHAAPYFYDAHVIVSVEQGAVVLRGFVFSDWDLQEAIRIAGGAAGDRRVINDLSIKQGGRR
jgi:osmotically-inducible protein OsmY